MKSLYTVMTSRMLWTDSEPSIRWRCNKTLERVNALDGRMGKLPDTALREAAMALRGRRRKGSDLDSLAPEMFALVREATRRTINIRQYDIQMRAAAALSRGAVIQMNTGEGKTFVAPPAACLHALDGRGVHVLTANDYLAARDHALLKNVYNLIGFSCAVVLSDSSPADRAAAYRADVTYTTVQQLGFDFLRQYFDESPEGLRTRDMWQFLRSDIDGSSPDTRALRGRHCAILDEVDSILIDYARTPLSMTVEAKTQRPVEAYHIARKLALQVLRDSEDYTLDKGLRKVDLTPQGKRRIGDFQHEYGYLHLMDSDWEEFLQCALMAQYLFRRDEHYVVRSEKVLLVDQTSGRLMLGQRLGGELHQALEVKEGVPIHPRHSIVKKISIQSLIRPYRRLAGMTGTAWESRREFLSVYRMPTIRFATRLPLRRQQRPDLFFCHAEARWERVAADIRSCHNRGQPVLLGTRSVKEARLLSELLEEQNVPHEQLNAVDHAKEAQIIHEAGHKGRVTIAARLAGRGVEIKLAEGVEALGGLRVIGAERHVLRRFDGQLAGRCGRHGDPGSAQFYVTLEDEVFQLLSERRRRWFEKKYGSQSRNGFHSRELEREVARSQAKFAEHFAAIRKSLLAEELAKDRAESTLFGQGKL